MGAYPEGSMGAGDEGDVLNAVDRWLVGGVIGGLDAALREQAWPADVTSQLAAAWLATTGLSPGGGFVVRGHGWRAWYPDGTIVDSRSTAWTDVPDGLVLAVSYVGPMRWMAQGVDPFWLSDDGLIYDSRTNYPDGHTNPRWAVTTPVIAKMGVFVTDAVMRHTRWLATLAFTL